MFAQITGSGALYLERSLLFWFHTFGVNRFIDVLDPENQSGCGEIQTGSGALGLTEDVWYEK